MTYKIAEMKKDFQPRVLYPVKPTFKSEEEIKILTNKQKT